jgi:putative transposase
MHFEGPVMARSDINGRRVCLMRRILDLPEARLADIEKLLDGAPAANVPLPAANVPVLAARDWPHAPLHRLSEQGTYIVTSATYEHEHRFAGAVRLDHLEKQLLTAARSAGWHIEAWAVFSNHYHFVGHAQPGCEDLSIWIARLHHETACRVNELDGHPARQVWHNFWDTKLTYEKSYLARLSYVHQNPVKHGLVQLANQYRWCSAAWFERSATPAQVRTIYSFKTDKVNVPDDFAPR